MIAQLLTPFHSREKRQVLDAISSLGLKVTPEEIALKEGLPLHLVTRNLNEIATETSGNLRVSTNGTIQYVFEPNFELQYITNAARNVWLSVWRIVANLAMMVARVVHLVFVTLFRVSIGVLLIASVLAVVALIIISIFRLFAGNDDNGGIGDSPISGGEVASGLNEALSGIFLFTRYFLFDWLFDWWLWGRYYCNPFYGCRYSWWSPWYSPYDAYYGCGGRHYYYDDNSWVDPFFSSDARNTVEKDELKNEKGPDFLTICYQFVFGPEDTNKNIGERYWRSIAAVIRNNGGAVVAEQLAPFTGNDDQSEDWMLPILTRFDGTPEVSESGNIIYLFEKLAPRTNTFASQQPHGEPVSTGKEQAFNADQLRNLYQSSIKRQPELARSRQKMAVPTHLEEEVQEFVDFDPAKLTPAILLGIVEVTGSVYLLMQSGQVSFLEPFKPLILALLGYGVFFFAYPAGRALILATKNSMIEARNDKRLQLAGRLISPAEPLALKLAEARQMQLQIAAHSAAGDEAYTTEKDLLEQQF